jgi:hypothetical protein
MELKQLSREELMDFLTDGVPIPETALGNDAILNFYFEELVSFINIAQNDFWARREKKFEIIVSFGEEDYIVLRVISDNMNLLMYSEDVAENIEDISADRAQDIIGLVYGLIVYNERWKEVCKLADSILKSEPSSDLLDGKPLKLNSIEMKNLKQFIKKNKKYM